MVGFGVGAGVGRSDGARVDEGAGVNVGDGVGGKVFCVGEALGASVGECVAPPPAAQATHRVRRKGIVVVLSTPFHVDVVDAAVAIRIRGAVVRVDAASIFRTGAARAVAIETHFQDGAGVSCINVRYCIA